jgi:hypothetical protein
LEEVEVGGGSSDGFGGEIGSIGSGDLSTYRQLPNKEAVGRDDQYEDLDDQERRGKERRMWERGWEKKRRNVPSITIHNVCQTTQIQSILLRREPFAEAIGNLIWREKGDDHNGELDGNEGERADVPPLEDDPLLTEVFAFASGEVGARIAGRGDGGLDVGGEVAAAVELYATKEDETERECVNIRLVPLFGDTWKKAAPRLGEEGAWARGRRKRTWFWIFSLPCSPKSRLHCLLILPSRLNAKFL